MVRNRSRIVTQTMYVPIKKRSCSRSNMDADARFGRSARGEPRAIQCLSQSRRNVYTLPPRRTPRKFRPLR